MYDSLTKMKPETMINVMLRATKYIKLEEDQMLEMIEKSKLTKKDKTVMEVVEPCAAPSPRQAIYNPPRF